MFSKLKTHFNLDNSKREEWQPVRCPYHEDSTASAGINLSYNRFSCLACSTGKTLETVHYDIFAEVYDANNEEVFEDEENNFSFLDDYFPTAVKSKPIKKQVQALSQFLLDKKLEWDTIEHWGGEYVADERDQELLYGYLKFTLPEGGYTARKILPMPDDKRPRFKNSKNDKAILGNFREHKTVILVEGLTDFLTMWQLGYTNVCTPLGSKFSEQQAYLLRDKHVFIIFDRDYAGYKGALAATELLKRYGCSVIVVELPDNKKPKNDISDMYVADEQGLRDFLKVALTKHATYDSEYVAGIIKDTSITKVWRTGIPGIDKAFLGGFNVGVYAFAGEEKIGKSLTVVTMADTFVREGARVLLATYELPKLQYWCRLASRYTQHTWAELEVQPSLITDQIHLEYLAPLADRLKIEVGITMDEIIAARDSFDIVIIDYIQRMPAPIAGMDENTAVLKNNRSLSEFMSKYNKTVVMISSMPRSSYGKSNATMYKGTGDIEYTVQGGILMQKEDDNTISYLIRQNTRGKSGIKVFSTVDWGHQTSSEIESYI